MTVLQVGDRVIARGEVLYTNCPSGDFGLKLDGAPDDILEMRPESLAPESWCPNVGDEVEWDALVTQRMLVREGPAFRIENEDGRDLWVNPKALRPFFDRLRAAVEAVEQT
jgi:hypothetical protein